MVSDLVSLVGRRAAIIRIDAVFRLSVRTAAASRLFPLGEALPSTTAAESRLPLFSRFASTMASSDFSSTYMLGVRLVAFPSRPGTRVRVWMRPPSHRMGLALAVIGKPAQAVDAGAGAQPQPDGFSVVGDGAIVLAEIERRAGADEMGERQIGIEAHRLFAVGERAIVLMAHGPEIGAVGKAFRVIRRDLDGLIEVGFGLGEVALECAGVAALRIGRSQRPPADGAGIDHQRAAGDGLVRRGLIARARGLVGYQLCMGRHRAEQGPAKAAGYADRCENRIRLAHDDASGSERIGSTEVALGSPEVQSWPRGVGATRSRPPFPGRPGLDHSGSSVGYPPGSTPARRRPGLGRGRN